MACEEIALRLQNFWKDEGCPSIPPYGAIPALWLTPDAFFGILAARPWRSCQRVSVVDLLQAPYGDDPLRPVVDSRLQVTQQGFSGDPRDGFIESLKTLGLDLCARDLRFVPSECEQPHLAVRGALWRVLIDGVDVGSISYLHRLAGFDLKEVAMVAEYSLCRLAICLGGQDEDGPTEPGRQIASYALEASEPETINSLLRPYTDECERALESGLYFPAYEHVLTLAYLNQLAGLREPVTFVERSEQAEQIASLAHGCASAYKAAGNV